MATPSDKLADSLSILKALQDGGRVAIHTSELTRVHRERLLKNGFLQEVMKGWYIASSPGEPSGESTVWYASYWEFCAFYLNKRFAKDWCLSPEQSLLLHVGNWTVPQQLLVRSPRGNNKVTSLLHNTSLLDARYEMPAPEEIEEKQGLRLYSLPCALVNCSPQFFIQHKIDAQAALSTIQDASDILRLLLAGGHTQIAGRLAGAFRNIGYDLIADEIIKTMRHVDYNVREANPFDQSPDITFSSRKPSPYINRLRVMWSDMRNVIIKHFPKAPGLPVDIKTYLQKVEDIYVTDAYHSLSIEGYLQKRNVLR